MHNYYNLEKLIKIQVIPFREDNWHTYKCEKRFLGMVIRKEGVYSNWGGLFYTLGEIKEKCPEYVIIDGVLFIKPKCKLFFENDFKLNETFETYEDALSRAQEIQSQSGKWINIES